MKRTSIRLAKYIVTAVTAILIITSASFLLLILLFPRDRISDFIIETANEKLHRTVTIGSLNYGFGGFLINDLALKDREPQKKDLLKAQSVLIRPSLKDLIRGKIVIRSAQLEGIVLHLSFDDEGKNGIDRLLEDIPETKSEKDEKEKNASLPFRSLRIIESKVIVRNAPGDASAINGTYALDTTILPVDKGLKVEDTKIELPGKSAIIEPELIISLKPFSIKGKTDIRSVNLQVIYDWRGAKGIPYQIVDGTVEDLEITESAIRGHAIVTSSLSDSNSLLHADGLCRVDLKKELVQVTEVKGRIESSSFILEKLYLDFNGNLLNLQVRNAAVKLQEVAPAIPSFPTGLSGEVKGSVGFDQQGIDASITTQNVGFYSGTSIVSGLSIPVEVIDSRFKISGVQCKILGYPATVDAASLDNSLKNYFANVHFPEIEIKPSKGSGSGTNLDVPFSLRGRISAHTITYDSLTAKDIKAVYSVGGKTITVSRFTASLFGGSAAGTATISNAGSFMRGKAELRFSQWRLQDIATLSKKFTGRFFGVASGRAVVAFGNSSSLLDSLTGNVEFQIGNGKIADTGIQNGLGLLLSELKYKLKDMEFSTIYGNIAMEPTLFNIRSFIFSSDEVRLRLNGGVRSDFISPGGLNIQLEFTPAFIEDLPGPALSLIRFDRYRSGNWYILPFMLKGDITKGGNITRIKEPVQ